MVGRWAYDLMYRVWAPWDAVGVRSELRSFIDGGSISPTSHPLAIDLGCGTGANVVFLAQQGFDTVGVDFSPVALAQAQQRAVSAGVDNRATFVRGDLTSGDVGVSGTFDLLLDFGTLDDLNAAGRRRMANLVVELSHPGSIMLFWCFYGNPATLPRMSFRGPSRMVSVIRPGEEHELFGDHFDIVRQPTAADADHTAWFLLTRRDV